MHLYRFDRALSKIASQKSCDSENEEATEIEDMIEGDTEVTSDGRIVKSKITQLNYTKAEMVGGLALARESLF